MSVGLVLEGGGMRGAYTSGVLCAFEDHDVYFPSIYGVSAGACNALSYISGQAYHNHDIFYQYVQGDKYVSLKNFIKHRCIFDFDYIFGDLFHTILPFDYQAFAASTVKFYIGATNVKTGQPVFFTKEDTDEQMDVIRGSSSLPFLSEIIKTRGYQLLDGGITVPIPIERSICNGNLYNVIVLTRDRAYRKENKPEFPNALMQLKYHKYPALIKAMKRRGKRYNEQRLYCEKLEQKQKAILIIPSKPIDMSRYEKDSDTLMAVFDLGYADAVRRISEVKGMLAQYSSTEQAVPVIL